MKPPIVIKKYGNRRMYDTAASRYVNLDDLAAAIREGGEVQVVDAKTGQDLTRVTLTQIITEDAKDRPTGLPLELLRQLILASDQVRQEFLSWYLKSAFDTYQKVQDAVQNRLSEVQSAILSPVDWFGIGTHRQQDPHRARRRRRYMLSSWNTCDGPSVPLPCLRWLASWSARPAWAWPATMSIPSLKSRRRMKPCTRTAPFARRGRADGSPPFSWAATGCISRRC